MSCNLSLPEITLPALDRTKRFLPENQQPVVDEVIRQVKEIAKSFFREDEYFYRGVCIQLKENRLDRVVATVLGEDPLDRSPYAQRARVKIHEILTRSLSHHPLLNPPGAQFPERQTVYLAQALLQRASPFYQKIVVSFREYMDDLEKRFVNAFNSRAIIGLEVDDPALRRDTIGPFVALTAGGPATFTSISIPGIDERIKLVFFDVIQSCSLFAWSTFSHEMAHQALARAPGMQEELMGTIDLAGLFSHEKRTIRGETRSIDIKGILLKNHILASQNELLSDLIGLLHQGPTAVLGFVRFFQEFRKNGELLTAAQPGDPHPIDYFRVLFGKAVIELLPIDKADKKIVLDKLDTLVAPSTLEISGRVNDLGEKKETYSHDEAMKAARKIAKQLLETPLLAIRGTSLLSLFAWETSDEKVRKEIQNIWKKGGLSPYSKRNGLYSAHTVAAALHRVIVEGEDEFESRNLMLQELTEMARQNPNNLPPKGEVFQEDPLTSHEVRQAEKNGFARQPPIPPSHGIRFEEDELWRMIEAQRAADVDEFIW